MRRGWGIAALVCIGALAGPATASAGTLSSSPVGGLNFGQVDAGSSSQLPVTISNSGTDTTISGDLTSNAEFASDGGCTTEVLGDGGSCIINVTFSPVGGNNFTNASLIVNSDAGQLSVSLKGDGVVRSISLTPTAHDFGSILVNSMSSPQTFTLTNESDVSITVFLPTLNEASYQRTLNDCMTYPRMMSPGSSCSVDVVFAPTSAGAKPATLKFDNNGVPPDYQNVAVLSGTGALPPQPPPTQSPQTSPAPVAAAAAETKRCKKSQRLKRGKCVKKKRKRK